MVTILEFMLVNGFLTLIITYIAVGCDEEESPFFHDPYDLDVLALDLFQVS